MPAKISRLDARRDPEAVEWAKELRETETWFHSERFGHITRLHTPFEVVSLRGSLQEDYTIARESARKMHDYLVSRLPRRSFAETGGRRRLKIQSGDVRLDQIRKKQMREQ